MPSLLKFLLVGLFLQPVTVALGKDHKDACRLSETALKEKINESFQIPQIKLAIFEIQYELAEAFPNQIDIINDIEHDEWFHVTDVIQSEAEDILARNKTLTTATVTFIHESGVEIGKNIRIDGHLISGRFLSKSPLVNQKSDVKPETPTLELISFVSKTDKNVYFKTTDDLSRYLGSCRDSYNQVVKKDPFNGEYLTLEKPL